MITKVGMNSQTLRIVDDSTITDYHVNDGKTGSHMMDLISGKNVDLSGYETKVISNLEDIMSWGSDKDKMTGIYFTEVTKSPLTTKRDSISSGGYVTQSLSMFHVPSIPRPIAPVFIPVNRGFTETNENKTNFGSLFGK